jgi:peptidoglycan hydrolase CwlO-like protein
MDKMSNDLSSTLGKLETFLQNNMSQILQVNEASKVAGSKSDDKAHSIRDIMNDRNGMEKHISKCKRRMKKLVNKDLKKYKDGVKLEVGRYI